MDCDRPREVLLTHNHLIVTLADARQLAQFMGNLNGCGSDARRGFDAS